MSKARSGKSAKTDKKREEGLLVRNTLPEHTRAELEAQIAARKRTEHALKELVAGTAAVTGEEFFPALVRHLALSLNVRYALISECVNQKTDRVRSLAWWVNNALDENIEYDVKDTTCEAVLKEGKMCYYPDHVQELFPKETALVSMKAQCYLGTPLFDTDGSTLGHLFIIDDKPLVDAEQTKSIMSIFAARAAMELQRKLSEETLQNLVAGTAAVTAEEFFPALVKHLAIALGVRFATIAECIDEEFTKARVLSRWQDNNWVRPFEYEVKTTPCSVLLNTGSLCYYPDNLIKSFPDNTYLPTIGAVCYLGVPLFDPSGKTIGHMYILDDKPLKNENRAKSIMGIFAARAAMELYRSKSEERIREQATLIENAHDAIMVQDLNNNITYWNKGAEGLYGYTSKDVIGNNLHEILHIKESQQFTEAMIAVRTDGEWSGELRQQNRSGKEIIIDSRWTLIRNRDNNPKSILIINSDITEKKTLEAQFLRTQRMESIGTLASGVAHDLNNVLTPITLAAETLAKKLSPKQHQELLDMIQINAKRGAGIVNQVLSFTRGVEGERIALDVGHLIREVEKISRETFPRSIRTLIQISNNLWPILGDATQIHQVLLNLSVNARDAMPNGGVLTISSENVRLDENYSRMHLEAKVGPHVFIKVSDTGTGIPHHILDKIFEPFFTTKELGKGTGLGLSTSMAIVKSHGGFVNVYSEEGRGTTFQVYIPAVEGKVTRKREQPLEELLGNGETILVVDDEKSVRDITRSTLISYGYAVLMAADGTEALAQYTQHKASINAILMDMMMPYLDGPSTIRAIKKINPKVKIIATSGLMTGPKMTEARNIGVNAFLAKPYTSDKLLVALKKVLQKKK